MTVSKFRVTASQLESRVKAAAKDSANVVFVPPPEKKSMAGMMLWHQALACMRQGRIVGTPKQVQEGLWEFRMERFAANQLFELKVAARCRGATVEQLYAIF